MRPPPSNLGPMAEPWARWITDQTLQNAEGVERLGGDASNDGRINNSLLDSMADQIQELNARQSQTLFVPDLTTPVFNQSGATVSTSTTISLPRPLDAQRIGWVSLSGTPSVTPAYDSTVFVTFSIDGRPFYRSSIGLPPASATPAGWTTFSFQGVTGFMADPEAGGALSIQLQARGLAFGAAGNRTATLGGITATVAYAQRS